MYTKLLSGTVFALVLPGTCNPIQSHYVQPLQEPVSFLTSASDVDLTFAGGHPVSKAADPPPELPDDPPEVPGGVQDPIR